MNNMVCVLISRIFTVLGCPPVLADLAAPPIGGYPEDFEYVSPMDRIEELKLKMTVFLCVSIVVIILLILVFRRKRRKKDTEHGNSSQTEQEHSREN